MDDRSFIVDDDNLDNEVAEINNTKITGLAKENNCYTINEVPEGRSSRFNSSRASSRSSLGSESTRTSSNFYGDQSDHLSSGLADMNRLRKVKSDSHQGSEESGSGSDNMNLNNGSKNALLDALMRKFNVDVEPANESGLNQPSDDPNKIVKQTTKYTGDDSKKKQSELQKKINRTQIEKQQQQQQTQTPATTPNTNTNFMKNFISKDILDRVDATSSMDDDPKQIKIVRSTGTQMSAVSKITTYKQRLKPNAVTRLPQSFECKYIGKTKCVGLWGIKNIREPVDRLVRTAKRHKSLNELPSVEALISEKGIYIVQKSKSNNAELPKTIRTTTTTTTNSISSGHATIGEKLYRSGLLPISNISYAVQDNIFGKIFSCIVVRERDNKTISECYSFLCSRNDVARRMALAITVAFKEYGKLLQIKESRINQTIKLQGATNDPDSYA